MWRPAWGAVRTSSSRTILLAGQLSGEISFWPNPSASSETAASRHPLDRGWGRYWTEKRWIAFTRSRRARMATAERTRVTLEEWESRARAVQPRTQAFIGGAF